MATNHKNERTSDMVYRYEPGDKKIGHCQICSQALDVADVPCSLDCGGDCLLCMADAGDPQCIAALQRASTETERSMIQHWLPNVSPTALADPEHWPDLLRQAIVVAKRQGRCPSCRNDGTCRARSDRRQGHPEAGPPEGQAERRERQVPGLDWDKPIARHKP